MISFSFQQSFQNRQLFVIFLICLLASVQVEAQTHLRDLMKVDSINFLSNRENIQKLPVEDFKKGIFTIETDTIPYRFLEPKETFLKKRYPLVIAFHNSSRIGNDNEKQLEHLTKTWLKPDIRATYPCYVLAPQFNERSSNYSKSEKGFLESRPSQQAKLVLSLIKELQKRYPNIDDTKIYLIGYSMGASTAQNLMAMAPKEFRALVSIAAVPDLSNLKAFKRKPILLIHGQMDLENPYEGSVAQFERLKGNNRLILKTYDYLNHATITIPFLSGDEIPKWLFKH